MKWSVKIMHNPCNKSDININNQSCIPMTVPYGFTFDDEIYHWFKHARSCKVTKKLKYI